ncbi:MAG: site-2 protease family protein [Acidobacteriota bacterium]
MTGTRNPATLDLGGGFAGSGWSFRAGAIAGIPVYVHATIGLLACWVILLAASSGRGAEGALRDVVLLAAVFGCLVLHELGHALAARRFGISTVDITLLPIGGVARLERMPRRPVEELLVAVAGPAVNFAVAGLLLAWIWATGSVAAPELWGTALARRLGTTNLVIGVFNLVPAFPLDGGRVLRAVLAWRFGHLAATRIAARVARGLSVLLGVAGVIGSPVLVVIAIFVWAGAGAEAALAEVREALRGVRVRDAMLTEVHTLPTASSVAEAVAVASLTAQPDFPVVEGGTVVGLLTRADLVGAVARGATADGVACVMSGIVETAAEEDPLRRVAARAFRGGTILVLRGPTVIGMLTPEHVRDVVRLRSALPPRATARPDQARLGGPVTCHARGA